MQQDMLDNLEKAENWADQLAIIDATLTICASRIITGLQSVMQNRIPYTIMSPESTLMFQELVYPELATTDLGVLPYPVQLINADISLGVLWVGVNLPVVEGSMIGRHYAVNGRHNTKMSNDGLCLIALPAQDYFAPIVNKIEYIPIPAQVRNDTSDYLGTGMFAKATRSKRSMTSTTTEYGLYNITSTISLVSALENTTTVYYGENVTFGELRPPTRGLLMVEDYEEEEDLIPKPFASC